MPKAKRKNTKSSQKIRQHNLARGMVGALRSHTSAATNDRFQKFHHKLRETLFAARTNLKAEDFDGYLQWLDEQLTAQLPLMAFPRAADGRVLNAFIEAEAVSLNAEMAWVASRLAASSDAISKFRKYADEFESAIFNQNGEFAKASYRAILTEFGASLWLMEIRLSLRQAVGGLEHQKKYVERIRRKFPRGALGYMLYFFSVRYEPQSTLAGFQKSFTERLDKSIFQNDVKIYLKYRLALSMPRSQPALASIIRVAQSFAEIDVYETFIAVAQKIVADNDDAIAIKCVRAAVEKLSGIVDWRLDKLALFLGVTRQHSTLKLHDVGGIDLLLVGNIRSAYRCFLRHLKIHSTDVEAAAMAGICRTFRPRKAPSLTSKRILIDQLCSLFGKTLDFQRAEAELEKFASNLAALPSARVLQQIRLSRGIPSIMAEASSQRMQFLNTNYLDVRDILIVPQQTIEDLTAAFRARFPTSVSVQAFSSLQGGIESDQSFGIGSQAACIVRSLRLGNNRLFSKAAEALIPNIDYKGSIADQISTVLAIRYYLASDNKSFAINLMAKAIARKESMRSIINVADAIEYSQWADLEKFSGQLDLPIVLDLFLRETGDSLTATHRRYAFEEFLNRNGFARPSEINIEKNMFDSAMLIYFLKFICIPSVLDMWPALASSRAVPDERRKICALLVALDPPNQEHYQRELFEIESRKVIQEGLKQVDSSRLHVDTEAIAKWAVKEQRESYARYRDLLKANVGIAPNVEALFAILEKSDTKSLVALFDVPENEADELLLRMFTALRDRFLLNPTDGLDSYLSKRVRHGSILNFLRSPVENAKLTTKKESEGGKYKPNIYWLEKLRNLGGEQKAKVNKHFLEFAESFDDIILNLKDQILQIKTPSKPTGAFEIRIPSHAVTLIRSVVKDNDDFNFFIDICFTVLWGLLKPCLDEVTKYLETQMKTDITAVFEKLRFGLSEAADGSPDFPELSMAIGNASAEVHRQIQAVSGWFVQPESNRATHAYTVEQAIGIGVQFCRDNMRTFKPSITVACSETIKVSHNLMLTIFDLVWVALENVFKHCGLDDPWISIEMNTTSDSMVFLIKNQLASNTVTYKTEATLQKIRDEISVGSFKERVTREGNSGLIKVASSIEFDDACNLQFGFLGTTEFFFQAEIRTSPSQGGDNWLAQKSVEYAAVVG